MSPENRRRRRFSIKASASDPSHGADWFKVSINFERSAQKVHLQGDYFSRALARFGTEFSNSLKFFSAFSLFS
jgi:hypothetical protein